MVYVGNNRVAKKRGPTMFMYIYVSEATNRTIITKTNHGKTWEMPDGEVYDFYKEFDAEANVVICDGQLESAWECKEAELT
jgi:hypothetical protein